MKQYHFLSTILFTGLLSGVYSSTFAEIIVDKSDGVLTITSNMTGKVLAKIVSPNNKLLVNEKYSGSSFTWTPAEIDGAYRYDVRVILGQMDAEGVIKNDYVGGVIEVKNGQIITATGE